MEAEPITAGSPPKARSQSSPVRRTSGKSSSAERRRPDTGTMPRMPKSSGETARDETRRVSPSVSQSRIASDTPATASTVDQSLARISSRSGGEIRQRVPWSSAPVTALVISAGSVSKTLTTPSGSGNGIGASHTLQVTAKTRAADPRPSARVPVTPSA
jgi:hypothetical protein